MKIRHYQCELDKYCPFFILLTKTELKMKSVAETKNEMTEDVSELKTQEQTLEKIESHVSAVQHFTDFRCQYRYHRRLSRSDLSVQNST